MPKRPRQEIRILGMHSVTPGTECSAELATLYTRCPQPKSQCDDWQHPWHAKLGEKVVCRGCGEVARITGTPGGEGFVKWVARDPRDEPAVLNLVQPDVA